MSKKRCSVCTKPAEPAYSVTFDSCGCSVHADCVGNEETDYLTCPACTGTAEPVADYLVDDEPRPPDGIDYVLNPGTRSKGPGLIASAISLVRRTPASAGPAPVTFESLVRRHVPVQSIKNEHNMGLQHGLKEGLLIEDFLAAGYTLDELASFKDIGQLGPDRGRHTLVEALGLNATHVRDFPHLVTMAKVKELTGIAGADELGLVFGPHGLDCLGDTNWTAKDCARMGLSIDDLLGMGLEDIEQYQGLMERLTRAEQVRVEKQMGVTRAHLEALLPVQEEDVATASAKRVPAVAPKAAAAAPVASKGTPTAAMSPPIVMDDEESLRRRAMERARNVVVKKAPKP